MIQAVPTSASDPTELSRVASVEVGPFSLDRETYTVCIGGTTVTLTSGDFDLFAFLLDNRHRLVGHRELARQVFGASAGDTALLIRVHICTLRRALGPHRDLLKTVRARGYRILISKSAAPMSPPAAQVRVSLTHS